MKITNFVAVRAGVVGKFSKAFKSPRGSAAEAMLVLRMTKDVLQVVVFGKIKYEPCSELGENLRLTAKGKPDSISENTNFLALGFLLAADG